MREAIAELLDREPFVPFVLVMTSGDRYEVRYPALVIAYEAAIYVMRPRSDRWDILRLNQLCAIEVLDPAA